MYTVLKMCTGTLSQNISKLSQKYTRCPRINLTLSAEKPSLSRLAWIQRYMYGICSFKYIYIWYRNKTQTLASAPSLTDLVFIQKFRLFMVQHRTVIWAVFFWWGNNGRWRLYSSKIVGKDLVLLEWSSVEFNILFVMLNVYRKYIFFTIILCYSIPI